MNNLFSTTSFPLWFFFCFVFLKDQYFKSLYCENFKQEMSCVKG